MKRLLVLAFLLTTALPGATRESFQDSVAPQPASHPALYSFADVYRLTVSGPISPLPLPVASGSPMRVAAGHGTALSEVQFSFSAVREPGRWALLLAGLAIAAWVARRRIDAVL